MPSTSNALTTAIDWIAGALTGNLGTMIAVLAIAGTGFAMLQGRLAVRDGARVVLGCFILFGAPAIAHGLAELASASSAQSQSYSAPPPPPPPIPAPPQPNNDPYAGASVPM